MRFNGIKLTAAGSAVAAAAVLGLVPGATGTAFGASCTGATSIVGEGASFQRTAQLAWGAESLAPNAGGPLASGFGYDGTIGCSAFAIGGGQTVRYAPTGSGAGRAAFGATPAANTRPVSPAAFRNFGGVDEAPTRTELANANAGGAGSSDDAQLNTFPVAASSIAVVVKLPSACTLAVSRRQLTQAAVEGVFNQRAAYDTWGELFPALASTACNTLPVNRVVRYDSSGTTFQFKRFLEPVDPTAWASLANRDWPTRTPNWYTSNAVNGAGAQLASLNGTTLARDNSGATTTLSDGVAYADLATARSAGFDSSGASDRTFWVRVERPLDRAFVSPAANGDTTSSAKGANCNFVTYSNVPASTTDSWYDVQGVATAADYPICALTYALAWTTPRPFNFGYTGGTSTTTPFTSGEQTAVKAYLDYIINGGQDRELTDNDYSAIPASLQAIAQTGINSLTF